jgi:hypothetical protein
VRLLVLAGVALGCTPPTGIARAALSAPSAACFNPADFGAEPTPPTSAAPTDARAGLQAAFDAAVGGGTVCIPPGRWYVARAPRGAYNAHTALELRGGGVTIAGAGPESVLAGFGDQGLSDISMIALDPGSHDVTIRDLTLDTSAMNNTSEQTHALAIGTGAGAIGPVSDVRIAHVRFIHPDATDGSRKGDCVRILGNSPATRVERVSIVDSTFAQCARSGIGVQRNVHGLIIANNQFPPNSWDQAVDFEPTGDPKLDVNDTTVIAGNVFHDDPSAKPQGDFAVSLGGAGAPAGRIVVIGNVFEGRGLTMYRVADTLIADNTFNATMTGGYGVLDVENISTRLVIHHNTIHRAGFAGPLIRITPHSGGVPSDIVIDHNAGLQDTAFHAFYLESASNVIIDHNLIRFGTTQKAIAAIYERATATAVAGVLVESNQAIGAGYAVIMAASPYAIDAVVRGNLAPGSAGVLCVGVSPISPTACPPN